MNHRQSHGYTLTDILGVCGLMAAAALLVYPFLGEKSRRETCQSNLKQLSRAILLYAQDHDDQLPLAVTAGGMGWVRRCGLGFPEHDAVLVCPDDRGLKRSVDGDNPNGFSYIANGTVMPSSPAQSCSTAAIEDPAYTLLLAERKHDVPAGWSSPAATLTDIADLRHRGSANWAFVDGHVEWALFVTVHGR